MRKKSEERRQAILDIAAGIFNEMGFERASMAEISSRLGGSKATLYNYFSSKEEIFMEVMRCQAGEQFTAAFASLDENEELAATLQRFGAMYLTVVMAPEVVAIKRMVYYYAERSAVGKLLYERGPKLAWTCAAGFLQRAMEKNQLRTADSWVAAVQLRALLESEWIEQRLLGVVTNVSPAKIKLSVARAVDTFMRAYAPEKTG